MSLGGSTEMYWSAVYHVREVCSLRGLGVGTFKRKFFQNAAQQNRGPCSTHAGIRNTQNIDRKSGRKEINCET